MRKAARTVKPNARTGERHTWKDRERRRKEERQRMAAEALIVEDAESFYKFIERDDVTGCDWIRFLIEKGFLFNE